MSSIIKTNPDSFFINFKMGSPLANTLLTGKSRYDEAPATVLQVVTFDDGWLIAEVLVVKEQKQVTP